jgi:UTP-glucose-1-phosphate uridylyltransferase
MLVGKRYDVGTKELWVSTFLDFAKNDNRFKMLFE